MCAWSRILNESKITGMITPSRMNFGKYHLKNETDFYVYCLKTTSIGIKNYNFASTISYNWLIADVSATVRALIMQIQNFFQPVKNINDPDLFARNLAEAIDKTEEYYDSI